MEKSFYKNYIETDKEFERKFSLISNIFWFLMFWILFWKIVI